MRQEQQRNRVKRKKQRPLQPVGKKKFKMDTNFRCRDKHCPLVLWGELDGHSVCRKIKNTWCEVSLIKYVVRWGNFTRDLRRRREDNRVIFSWQKDDFDSSQSLQEASAQELETTSEPRANNITMCQFICCHNMLEFQIAMDGKRYQWVANDAKKIENPMQLPNDAWAPKAPFELLHIFCEEGVKDRIYAQMRKHIVNMHKTRYEKWFASTPAALEGDIAAAGRENCVIADNKLFEIQKCMPEFCRIKSTDPMTFSTIKTSDAHNHPGIINVLAQSASTICGYGTILRMKAPDADKRTGSYYYTYSHHQEIAIKISIDPCESESSDAALTDTPSTPIPGVTNDAGIEVEGVTADSGIGVEGVTTDAGIGVEGGSADAGIGVEGGSADAGIGVEGVSADASTSIPPPTLIRSALTPPPTVTPQQNI